MKFYIGDVRNFSSISEASFGVDYIFHAAALRQVPSCEFYPNEAVKTNIIGSENVINALNVAKSIGIKSIILTGGSQGKMKKMGDVLISVPSEDTQRIQECHLLIEHILCENTEQNFK